MSEAQYKKARRAINNLTDNELLKLWQDIEMECSNRELPNTIDVTISRMETNKLHTLINSCIKVLEQRGEGFDTMLKSAKAIVYAKAFDALWEFYEGMTNLTVTATHIVAVMLAGRGDTSREQVRLLDNRLVYRVADFEKVKQRTEHDLHVIIKVEFNGISLPELHKMCVDYYSGDDKNGERFLAAISQFDFYHPFIQIRDKHAPGKVVNTVKSKYDNDVRRLLSENMTIEQAVNKLAKNPLYSEIIEKWRDPTATTKKRLQRHNTSIKL